MGRLLSGPGNAYARPGAWPSPAAIRGAKDGRSAGIRFRQGRASLLHSAHPSSTRGRRVMTGVTPNAKNHVGLAPNASRFVDVQELPWEPTRFAGIESK